MPAPIANFVFSPTYGFSPISVQCEDLSDNAPTSWLWQFDNGDGTFATSTDQNPVHVFTAPPYLWRYIQLTVTNADGSDTKKFGPFWNSGNGNGVYLKIHNE